MPPFGRLAAVIVSAKSKAEAESYARALSRAAPRAARIEVLGPAEAPIAMIRGRHRIRFLVKAALEADLQAYLRAWFDAAPEPRCGIRAVIDIDPYNFV